MTKHEKLKPLTFESYHRLIERTSSHMDDLLLYSDSKGMSLYESFFSMSLCVAALAHALEIDANTVHVGIDAALAHLKEAEDHDE